MSYERKIEWLNKKRVIYRRNPINDTPTLVHEHYDYYHDGTHECYHLFNSKAKITTYRSLKWHFLVLYYLNEEGVEGDIVSLEDDMRAVFRFIATKENGFVTFFIKQRLLNKIIENVIEYGGDPPKNKIRKIIFKDFSGLSINQKLSIVGKLIGRKSISKDKIYSIMLEINDMGTKITLKYLAELLGCSVRTLHRNMGKELKNEKEILNEEI
jgi:hypothetical protein